MIPDSIPTYDLEGEKLIAVADLTAIVPKASLYSHLKALQETPRKIKGKSYLDLSQSSRILGLVEHLSRGGNIKGFLDSEKAIVAVPPGDLLATEPEEGEDWHDRLECLDKLHHIAEQGYLIPTAMLAHFLGVTSGTIRNQGERFRAYGFTLERSGEQWRGSGLYKVSKV